MIKVLLFPVFLLLFQVVSAQAQGDSINNEFDPLSPGQIPPHLLDSSPYLSPGEILILSPGEIPCRRHRAVEPKIIPNVMPKIIPKIEAVVVPTLAEFDQMVASEGKVVSCGPIGHHHVYKAYLLTFENGTQAVFKTDDGQSNSYRHEVFASHLAAYFGFSQVPPTRFFELQGPLNEDVLKNCPDLDLKLQQKKMGSLQWYVKGGLSHEDYSFSRSYDADKGLNNYDYYEKHLKSPSLKFFDFLQLNCDRKGHQNLVFLKETSGDREFWIDNGMGAISHLSLLNIRKTHSQYCQTMYHAIFSENKLTQEEKCQFAPPTPEIAKKLEGFILEKKGEKILSDKNLNLSPMQIFDLKQRIYILLDLHHICQKKGVKALPHNQLALAEKKAQVPLGPRSLAMVKALEKGTLNFSPGDRTIVLTGKKFGMVTSATRDFHQTPILSAGASPFGREVIKFDPGDSPMMEKIYQDFAEEVAKELLNPSLKNKKPFQPRTFFNFLVKYINNSIFTEKGNLENKLKDWVKKWETHPSRKNEDFLKNQKGESVPVIPIDAFLKQGLGVCRHHSLVAAYLIDRFTKEHSDLMPPKGQVFHVRRSLPSGGAHAWVVYSSNPGHKNGEVFHIDTLWNKMGDISQDLMRESLGVSGYGKSLIDEELSLFQ